MNDKELASPVDPFSVSPEDPEKSEAAAIPVAENSADGGNADAVARTVEKLANRHSERLPNGLFAPRKKGSGRHPKNCACGRCKQSQTPVENLVANSRLETVQLDTPRATILPPAPATEAEKELTRQSLLAVTHTMDGLAVLAVNSILRRKGADAETINFAKGKIIMTDGTRQGIVISGAAIAEKHGLTRLMPEVSLGIHLTAWLAGLASLVSDLNKQPDAKN